MTYIKTEIETLNRKGKRAYVTLDVFNNPIRCSEYAPGSWAARTMIYYPDGRIDRY